METIKCAEDKMIGLLVNRESRRGVENEVFFLKVCIDGNCDGSSKREATDWTMRVRFLSRDEGRGGPAHAHKGLCRVEVSAALRVL